MHRFLTTMALAASAAGAAHAQDLPARKPGLWQMKMTMAGQPMPMPPAQHCVDAQTDKLMSATGSGAAAGACSSQQARREGDTFVVETTNFTEETPFRGPPRTTRQDITTSTQLKVTEKFTMVDRDTIRYEFTVNDPGTWTRPWSGEVPMRRIEGPIYEYACHEGNYGLANILRAARVQEANAR